MGSFYYSNSSTLILCFSRASCFRTALTLLSPGDAGYARDARLKAPSSLAVAPNGTLYIADLGNIRIRAVSPNQPQPNSGGLVEISSPLDQELYLFNQVRPSGGRFTGLLWLITALRKE